MPEPALTEHVRQLETLLAQIREASAALLDQDMWDRWGRSHASDQEIAERTARERSMIEQRDRAQRQLAALVTELRARAPSAVAAWADAHDQLLVDFLAKQDPSSATAAGVANEERAAWQAVKRGEQPFVDGNTFFITFDRELYRRLFGL